MANANNQWVPAPLPSSQTSSNGGNKLGSIFPSAQRQVGLYDSDPIHNPAARGVRITADITADGGGTLILVLQYFDPASGKWPSVPLASSASWATQAQTRTLTIYPNLTTANGSATTDTVGSTILGTLWRVHAIVNTAAITFSVGAEYII